MEKPLGLISVLLALLVCDIAFVAGYQGYRSPGAIWLLLILTAACCLAMIARRLLRSGNHPAALTLLVLAVFGSIGALWLAGNQALVSSVEEAVPDMIAVLVFCFSGMAAALLGIGLLVTTVKTMPQSRP